MGETSMAVASRVVMAKADPVDGFLRSVERRALCMLELSLGDRLLWLWQPRLLWIMPLATTVAIIVLVLATHPNAQVPPAPVASPETFMLLASQDLAPLEDLDPSQRNAFMLGLKTERVRELMAMRKRLLASLTPGERRDLRQWVLQLDPTQRRALRRRLVGLAEAERTAWVRELLTSSEMERRDLLSRHGTGDGRPLSKRQERRDPDSSLIMGD